MPPRNIRLPHAQGAETDAASTSAEPEKTGGRLTINDIARLAEVSKKTVSRVLNKSPLVTEETRARVDAVIREHAYEPDPQARGLALRRAFLIGLIYDNPNPIYVVNMQNGVLDALAGTGFELVVRPCDRASPTFLEEMRAFVMRQRLAGVILPPSVSEDQSLARLLAELECPYVRIASVKLDRSERMVLTHDSAGAAAAAVHLADLGHRRIAHISGPLSFRSSHERRRGFISGLAERGLALEEGYDKVGGYTYDSGVERAHELLTMTPRPTAVFTGNDEMAVGVYRAAHNLGLSIPDDLSVVGYDDAPIASQVWPALSSVRLPIRDMGKIAAKRVLELGTAAPVESVPLVQFTPTLVARGSSAQAPG
jgi:LacI family transcriptional regulator